MTLYTKNLGCSSFHDQHTFTQRSAHNSESSKTNLIIMETLKLFIPPILIGSIIIEAYLSGKENLEHYERKDTITNVTIASLSVLLNLVIKGFIYWVYSLIHQKAIFQFEAGVISWIILFLLTDLQFYLFHLLGHKSRF